MTPTVFGFRCAGVSLPTGAPVHLRAFFSPPLRFGGFAAPKQGRSVQGFGPIGSGKARPSPKAPSRAPDDKGSSSVTGRLALCWHGRMDYRCTDRRPEPWSVGSRARRVRKTGAASSATARSRGRWRTTLCCVLTPPVGTPALTGSDRTRVATTCPKGDPCHWQQDVPANMTPCLDKTRVLSQVHRTGPRWPSGATTPGAASCAPERRALWVRPCAVNLRSTLPPVLTGVQHCPWSGQDKYVCRLALGLDKVDSPATDNGFRRRRACMTRSHRPTAGLGRNV
jgi:hypothetical protein